MSQVLVSAWPQESIFKVKNAFPAILTGLVCEFNEFKPRLKSPKYRFQSSACLDLEKFNTSLSRRSNSLNSASGLLYFIIIIISYLYNKNIFFIFNFNFDPRGLQNKNQKIKYDFFKHKAVYKISSKSEMVIPGGLSFCFGINL